MFGWEFPPHITGGLGTACYGLTRGLSHVEDLEVIFVVPKAHGDEDQSTMKLIGASDITVTHRKLTRKNFQQQIEYIEIDSKLVPYVDPEDYHRLATMEVSSERRLYNTTGNGKINFSGKYGVNLLEEIAKKRGAQVHYLVGSRKVHPMTAKDIMRYVPAFRYCDVYVCGPTPLVEAVRQAADACGVPMNRFHTEIFEFHAV